MRPRLLAVLAMLAFAPAAQAGVTLTPPSGRLDPHGVYPVLALAPPARQYVRGWPGILEVGGGVAFSGHGSYFIRIDYDVAARSLELECWGHASASFTIFRFRSWWAWPAYGHRLHIQDVEHAHCERFDGVRRVVMRDVPVRAQLNIVGSVAGRSVSSGVAR